MAGRVRCDVVSYWAYAQSVSVTELRTNASSFKELSGLRCGVLGLQSPDMATIHIDPSCATALSSAKIGRMPGNQQEGETRMQYLVEAARGPLPASPEQAIALLEGTVIPHFEYMVRLKSEGKLLAGGLPVGDRAFVCIIEAASNDEADRIVRDMPAWGVLEWKVTPLQSVEARAEMERKVLQTLKAGGH